MLCTCVAAFVTAFSMTAETVLVFHFGAGAAGLGLLAACWTLGMVVGSWYSGRALRCMPTTTHGVFAGRLANGAALLAVGLTS